MNILIGWLSIGIAMALFLIGVLAACRQRSDAEPRFGAKVMLISLRLAIGWHFFYEGVDKLQNPAWTSAGYLHEATGPLAPRFRELAGDPVVDMLTPNDDKAVPSALEQSWQNYLDAVVKFYGLDDAQAGKVGDALTPLKKETGKLLAEQPKVVEKIGAYPPPLKVRMTMKQRLEEYQLLKKKAAEFEQTTSPGSLPENGSDSFEAWKTARAHVNRWRGDLQKDLGLLNKDMKRSVKQALLQLSADKMPAESRKKVEEAVRKLRILAATEINGARAKVFDKIRLQKGHTYTIDMRSPAIDCYLRLEDSGGHVLAENAGVDRKASITYTVPEDKAARDTVRLGVSLLGSSVEPGEGVLTMAAVLLRTFRPDATYRIVAGSYDNEFGSCTVLVKDKAAKDPGKTLEAQITAKSALDTVRKPANPEDRESIDQVKDKLDEKIADVFRKEFARLEQKKQLSEDRVTMLARDWIVARKRKGEQSLDPLPSAVPRPWQQWSLLDWSDHTVKYGITAVGLLLLVGLLTRTACVAGAGFLLMFYLAMPPLPGWPESPKAEGHYLYVNKTLIEMLALLALATMPTGRWSGLDGFVQFLNPWRWRAKPAPGRM